jgi:hypothetical protein
VTVTDPAAAFLQTLTTQSNGKAKSATRKLRTALAGVNPLWALKTRRQVSVGLLDFCRDKGILTFDQLSVPQLAEHAAS